MALTLNGWLQVIRWSDSGFQPRWALAPLADCWTLFNFIRLMKID